MILFTKLQVWATAEQKWRFICVGACKSSKVVGSKFELMILQYL